MTGIYYPSKAKLNPSIPIISLIYLTNRNPSYSPNGDVLHIYSITEYPEMYYFVWKGCDFCNEVLLLRYFEHCGASAMYCHYIRGNGVFFTCKGHYSQSRLWAREGKNDLDLDMIGWKHRCSPFWLGSLNFGGPWKQNNEGGGRALSLPSVPFKTANTGCYPVKWQ